MFNDIYPDELPRALQHMLERNQIDGPTTLPRRSFLKILGVGGADLAIWRYCRGYVRESVQASVPRLNETEFVRAAS